MLNVGVDARFFTDSDEARKEKIRRTSIRASLLWREKSDTLESTSLPEVDHETDHDFNSGR